MTTETIEAPAVEADMECEVIPTEDRVLVKPDEAETKSAGGILLPEAHIKDQQARAMRGTVLAVGPGRALENGTLWPTRVKVGDVVIYGQYGSRKFDHDGEELVVVSERDLLALVRMKPAG